MVQYSDGAPAQVGDRVRGTGHNAQALGYDPAIGIDGIVVDVSRKPNDPAPLTVAFLHTQTGRGSHVVIHGHPLSVQTEYGDGKGFQKVG